MDIYVDVVPMIESKRLSLERQVNCQLKSIKIMSNKNTRRDFLKVSSIGSLGLVLGVNTLANAAPVKKITAQVLELEINPFIIISTDDTITLVNSRPDMGQGSTQAVPSILAEELEVDLRKVRIIQSDGKAKYGSQQSGGSSTVRGLWNNLRKTGAAAKEMLIETAAKRWKVSTDQCYAELGKVHLKGSDKVFSYGELAEEANMLEVPKNPKLKDSKDFKYLGKFHKRLDVPSRVTGKAVFGIDVVVPGMLYAASVHAPSIEGKIVSIDDSAALKISGVKKIVKAKSFFPGGENESVAVVATNYWSALKASRALDIKWSNGDLDKTLNSDKYVADMYEAAESEGIRSEEDGDFNAFYKASENTLEGIYETPFLAHAAIEPVNATAYVKPDGSVEVWAPIQGPDGAIGDAAGVLGISPDKVKINPTLLGGSFGRKAFMNFMKEAIDISRQVQAPVKLIWAREEDMAQGPYRPAMLSKMQGVIDGRNNLAALSHQAIGESIQGQHWNGLMPYQADGWLAGELAKENHKYNFGVHKVTYSRVETPIPILWWRSVYASNFSWGQECFIDEMAIKAGKEPIAARKELLKGNDRDLKVIQKLEDVLATYPALPAGHARGVAMFRSFSTMSAAAVEVKKGENGIEIVKVTSVIDCGQYVNPDHVKAQTEGNIVMGISAAVKGGITFSNGKCDQSNFHDYQFMRMAEMPAVDIHIIENQEAPGGVGEPGLPPIAPALGNAIFNLTGERHRKLPLDLNV
jgi:isoquinoline 1-oxidoreductase beta subunit